MKLTKLCWVWVVLLFCTPMLFAQSNKGKLGVGLDVGAQRAYGDRSSSFVNFGPGMEGFVTYRLLPFADIALGFGYNQIKSQFVAGGGTSTTDLFNFDLRGNFEVISIGALRPYVSLGAGLITPKVRNAKPAMSTKLASSFFGGGGFKVQLSPKLNVFVGADYRFTSTDQLDNPLPEGKNNDGYLTARTGVTYYFKGEHDEAPQIIASERVPFYELDSESAEEPYTGSRSGIADPGDMEEYVKLKSRVDALSENIGDKDRQIAELQSSVGQRKRRLSSLEQRAFAQPSKTFRSNSSMSGFTEIYKEALANYYNKNFSQALSLFEILLRQYSEHNLASSCQYWVGKSLFAMRRYQEAVEEFNKVLSYPRSLKKDDSLFHLGKAYMQLGMNSRAREYFSRLLQDYPRSEYVGEARSLSARL